MSTTLEATGKSFCVFPLDRETGSFVFFQKQKPSVLRGTRRSEQTATAMSKYLQAAEETVAKETAAKEAAEKETPAKETAAKETAAKETAAKETAAKETAVAVKTTPVITATSATKRFCQAATHSRQRAAVILPRLSSCWSLP